ncbi:hypothetical protein [Stenotrophomonas maltophilia]|uniref:hypothetical protein n=1 Tax=Stenotrophomonas maltophilia TaxID=40324 RepID=UPI003D1886B0
MHASASAVADKAFRGLIRYINEELYGRRFLRTTTHKGLIWVRVQEAHSDGALHYHACLCTPSQSLSGPMLRRIEAWWLARHGNARAQKPHSQCAALRYLVKHVSLKPDSAIVDLSHNYLKILD